MFDFLGGVLNGLGGLASQVAQAIAALIRLIIDAFNFLASVIVAVFNFFRGLFVAVGRFLLRINRGFFGRILPNLFNSIRTLLKAIEARLQPIIKFLKRVRDAYDRLYRKYVMPVLKFISVLRKITSLLRLAGLKGADQIDKFLTRLQGRIQRTFLDIRRVLNASIDLLNVVSDPLRLARAAVLIASGRRAAAVLSRGITGFPIGHFFPTPVNSLRPAPPSHEKSTCDGSGLFNPKISELLDGLAEDPALTPVNAFDEWPGVNVDKLAPLPFFDDAAYDIGDGDVAAVTLADVMARRVARAA